MATKNDTLAAKQRRQKMFLVVGGVALAALVAFQAPKVLNRGSSSKKSSAPATSSTPTSTLGSTTYAQSTGALAQSAAAASAVAARGGASARLAGVLVATSPARPTPEKGQLWSFSRFKVKDPFVPRVTEPVGATGAPSGAAAPTGQPTTGVAVPSGPLSPGGLIVPTTPGVAPQFGYATILVNGKPQQLQLKQFFPKGDPTFVLRGVGKRFVTIGVAGGKFTDGSAIKVQLGRQVTLLNTTTGQRYVIKVVFVGAQPEAIASFRAAPSRTTASK